MLDVHSEEFKYHYNRSKLKVKQWEDEFKRENGRIPTKADIKESSPKVRHYYKVYWQLKTQLLEETILGGSDVNAESSTTSRVLKEHTNIIEEKCQEVVKLCSPTTSSKDESKENNENAQTSNTSNTWGAHLNKPRPCPLDSIKDNFLNESVCEKLFVGSQFRKRNPRKSLKKLKSNASQASSSTKSTESLESPMSSQEVAAGAPPPSTVESACSQKIKSLIMSEAELSPLFAKGESKPRIISETKSVSNQPVSLVEKLALDPKKTCLPARKLDAGWIERCTDKKLEQKLSVDSGFESMESSGLGSSDADSKVVFSDNNDDDDDDDIIEDSDHEQRESSRLSFRPLKRKFEEVSTPRPGPSDPGVVEQVAKKIKVDPYQFIPDPPEKKSVEDIKKAKLEKKIKTGALNDNFVRINIKKKVFVRGKKNFNYTKHKKRQWKELKKGLESEDTGIIRCYKCGDAGHLARYCQKTTWKDVDAEAVDELEEEEGSRLPTLEEAEAMAKERAKKTWNMLPDVSEVPDHVEEPLKVAEALYEAGTVSDTPPEVLEALRMFGHESFRVGQEKAIMRILSGESTLVVVATGGGKSLCYQLPAYLYATRKKCISLVVSPLVSLMEDQVSGSLSFFKSGCLHTNQTPKQRESVIEDAKNGKLFALLVSPEAIVSGDTSTGLCNILKSLPPIAFACIDEVHCLSQWSHNFRPSYLMVTKVLKEKLGVRTILGLTATATLSTIESVTKELGIVDPEGVIRDVPIPDNLWLSVSRETDKDKALADLLRGPRFSSATAILIYCTRRDECERLAAFIRTVLKDNRRQSRLSTTAESYHAGMTFARRKQVQKAFLAGRIRIVVATIAFGMGINKADIRGVIHYNVPRDLESYVQEVGRAGRDGLPAQCHVFLDEGDLNELRRYIYANAVDRHVMRKLLQRVFVECKCGEKKTPCPGHEVAFDCTDTIQALDIPEEIIFTLLCYLELHSERLVKVLTPAFANCKIQSYHGVKGLIAAANKCPPLAVACALKANALKGGALTVNAIEVANAISWDSATVKSQLKGAEWFRTKDGRRRKSGVVVEFFGLAFRVVSRGDMEAAELDGALDYLAKRVDEQEKRSCRQLDVMFSALSHFALASYRDCMEECSKEKSDALKDAIRRYFDTEDISEEIRVTKIEAKEFDEDAVAADIRALICSYRDNSFNGRSVARILHGIQSPNYPASQWYKCRHWRQHVDKDFNRICKIATREILRLK